MLLARRTRAILPSLVALAMPLLQSSAVFGFLLAMEAAGQSNLLLMFKFRLDCFGAERLHAQNPVQACMASTS